MARHNRAMEDLQRSSSEWAQRRQARLDDQIRMEAIAEKLNIDADEALRRYCEATGGNNQKDEEPTLDQFYQRSEEQKKYELIFLVIGIGLSGWLAFKYL